MHNMTFLGVLLPVLLMIQVIIYSICIVKLIRRYKQQLSINTEPLSDVTIRWLLILASAVIVNWFVRSLLASLSFILGDQFVLFAQTAIQLSLLLTLYLLAIYRLQQLTIIGYQSGLNTSHDAKASEQNETVLNQDEKAFLSKVIQGKDF